jgi:TetR/AcrR family transcriptional repressor of nem operon
MGISKRQTVKNKQAIIDAATWLFRERGIDDVGLNELTREAGYRTGRGDCEAARGRRRHSLRETDQILFFSRPSGRHREKLCCRALASGVRRLGDDAQASYAQGLHATLRQFASIVESDSQHAAGETVRERAIALYSRMVGALVVGTL